MAYRLRTSKETQEILKLFEKRDHLHPYIVAKIALALAIRSDKEISKNFSDTNGLELNRQTVLGEYDSLFKALIEVKEQRFITDAEYFPFVTKMYLDEGVKLLQQEYKYSNDIFVHLVELDKGI